MEFVHELFLSRVGCRVFVGSADDRIAGVLTGIKIEHNEFVRYEVSWWDGRTHNCKLLEACEVEFRDKSEGFRIGFIE